MIGDKQAHAALFQITGVGVVETDLTTGRLLQVNRAFCEMVGYSEVELLNMTNAELTHPDDRGRDAHTFAAVQQGERRKGQGLTRCLRKDGEVAWLELNVTVLGDGAEAVNLAVVGDATERVRADAAVRESEARFRAFVTASADAVYHMNADWTEMRSLVGKDFIADTADPSRSWLDTYIHPDDQALVLEMIRKAVRTKSLFELEHRVVRLGGGFGWTYSRATPLLDGAGEVRGWLGTARDVTDRKQAEEALRDLNETLEQKVEARTEELVQSERRFSQAFYANPIPACITRLELGTLVTVNAAFVALTGHTQSEAVGRTYGELGLWGTAEDPRRLAAARADGAGFRDLELSLRAKDGVVRTVVMSGEVIELGGYPGLLKMFYDVTERKQGEAQVHRAIQEVMSETSWFSQRVVERLAHIRTGSAEAVETVALTKREREVLERLAGGLNNDAIAAELGVSTQTVRNYISVVYGKLGVNSRAEAIVWARERGIVGGRPER